MTSNNNRVGVKPPIDVISESARPLTDGLTLKLKHIIDKYNFYPGVFYNEENINHRVRKCIPNLDNYDGIFLINDAPDVPIDGFKGVEVRPSITKGISDRQILFQYVDQSHIKQQKYLDHLLEPSISFSGDVIIMANGQFFPQQFPRYKGVITAASSRFITQFNMRITQFINGSFVPVSGSRCSDEEYWNLLANHPYGISARGWGNYNGRFYELMACGRIPIHIDTNAPLLFEHVIDWDDYICRVPYDQLNNFRDIVMNFHNQFTDDRSFRNHQDKIRKLFETYCSVDGYIKHFHLYDDQINKIIGAK